MRMDLMPGQKNVSPRLMLNYLSTALQIKPALPSSWSELTHEHDSLLDCALPLASFGWKDVRALSVSVPLRSIIFTGNHKNVFAEAWKNWGGVPALALDDSGTGGALGLLLVLPWASMDEFMQTSRPPFVAHPDLLGGVFCFRVRDAWECRTTN